MAAAVEVEETVESVEAVLLVVLDWASVSKAALLTSSSESTADRRMMGNGRATSVTNRRTCEWGEEQVDGARRRWQGEVATSGGYGRSGS